MKSALISPNEPVFDFSDPPVKLGVRVAEVSAQPFGVAEPLYWQECPDNIVADQFYWDGSAFQPVPVPPPTPATTTQVPNGPTVIQ